MIIMVITNMMMMMMMMMDMRGGQMEMVVADWLLPEGIQWDTGADQLTPTIPTPTIPLFAEWNSGIVQ